MAVFPTPASSAGTSEIRAGIVHVKMDQGLLLPTYDVHHDD